MDLQIAILSTLITAIWLQLPLNKNDDTRPDNIPELIKKGIDHPHSDGNQSLSISRNLFNV
jgi:hypothetical protein